MTKPKGSVQYQRPSTTYGSLIPNSSILKNIAALDKNCPRKDAEKKLAKKRLIDSRSKIKLKESHFKCGGQMFLNKEILRLFEFGDSSIPAKHLPLGLDPLGRDKSRQKWERLIVCKSPRWHDLAMYIFEKAVNELNKVEDDRHSASWTQLIRERNMLVKNLLNSY